MNGIQKKIKKNVAQKIILLMEEHNIQPLYDPITPTHNTPKKEKKKEKKNTSTSNDYTLLEHYETIDWKNHFINQTIYKLSAKDLKSYIEKHDLKINGKFPIKKEALGIIQKSLRNIYQELNPSQEQENTSQDNSQDNSQENSQENTQVNSQDNSQENTDENTEKILMKLLMKLLMMKVQILIMKLLMKLSYKALNILSLKVTAMILILVKNLVLLMMTLMIGLVKQEEFMLKTKLKQNKQTFKSLYSFYSLINFYF